MVHEEDLVSVSESHTRISAYLRRVEKGEASIVADHKRPVSLRSLSMRNVPLQLGFETPLIQQEEDTRLKVYVAGPRRMMERK